MASLRQEFSNKRQEAAFTMLASQLSDLKVGLHQGESTMPPSQNPVTSPTSPVSTHLRLSSPERFSGESGDCRPFFTQCELHFEFNAAAF